MAAATNQDEVREILRAVALVKERLGVRTVLGVSNVSFGLPARPLVNSTFLAAAFGAGLDMPILNPLNARYRDTVATFRILNGQDAGCRAFLEAYANTADPYEVAANPAASSAVASREGGASPAPTEGDARVPADADRAIIVATVQGDIHDIGKNIVKMLLENYGFTVIDLGRDVAPEAIVAAARDTGARLIGLSALMTTTVGAMERTIALVHEQLPGVAVMVGGAVITQEFADQIGADFYAKDAAASTRVASAFFDD